MTLNQEYLAWIKAQNLDVHQADAVELLMFVELTGEQRAWLEAFCIRWDAATPQEQWGEPDPQEISAQLCEEADQALLASAL